MKMGDARWVLVAKRRAIAGAREPVQSLAWGPCPEPRTGAVSPPYRVDRESRLLASGRRVERWKGARDGCDRRAPRGAGCPQRERDGVRALARRRPQARRARGRVSDHRAGLAHAARLAGGARGRSGRDGGHRRVLEAGVGGAGGSLQVPAGQRAPRQTGPRPQDRRPGRAVALPAAGSRAAQPQPGAAQAGAHAAQPHALSQEPDPRPPARDEPAAQDHAGHRDQARLRCDRHDGQVGPCDARRARLGTTDPVVLADLARGQLRKKIPALRQALEGRFDEHVLVVGRILAHIDYLDEAIDELSAAIEQQLGPFAPAVELLCTIPGVGRRAPPTPPACAPAAAPTRPPSRSATRSSPPPGTCSRPARPTPTPAATSSPAATPSAPANASSASSNTSATTSRFRKRPRQPERDFPYSTSRIELFPQPHGFEGLGVVPILLDADRLPTLQGEDHRIRLA